MNDIIAIDIDLWNKIEKSMPDDYEWTVDAWLKERFGLEFLRCVHSRQDARSFRHLYRITNPAGHLFFMLVWS